MPFTIGEHTGVITATASLDYETTHEILFCVIAEDTPRSESIAALSSIANITVRVS